MVLQLTKYSNLRSTILVHVMYYVTSKLAICGVGKIV